jgi:hypothetical protein
MRKRRARPAGRTDSKSFVVQLGQDAKPERIAGLVESLESGEVGRFTCGRDLLRFLRNALRTSGSDDAKNPPPIDQDEKRREDS